MIPDPPLNSAQREYFFRQLAADLAPKPGVDVKSAVEQGGGRKKIIERIVAERGQKLEHQDAARDIYLTIETFLQGQEVTSVNLILATDNILELYRESVRSIALSAYREASSYEGKNWEQETSQPNDAFMAPAPRR